MRDIIKLFRQPYSAVNTSDSNYVENNQNSGMTTDDKQRKSLNAKRTFSRGLSIVETFFSDKKEKGFRKPKGVFLLMASGLLSIMLAVIMYIVQPYDAIFKWKLIFGDNGEIFNLWQNPPVDLFVKIYLFNITNPEEFMKGTEKMKVHEVGPYVYREKLFHDEVVFNDNGTISTVPKHPLIWNEELSMGNSEDDVFMLPNIALLSIAQVASDKSYFYRLPINLLIRQTNSQPIVQMTAKEFMFGYESPITTLGNKLMPDWIYFEKVGLIDRMYDFDGDFETIYTGEHDYRMSGLIETYRGSKNLKQWKGNHCSSIDSASDGTKFKSFIEPNDTLLFFRKSMCRAQELFRADNETTTIGTLSAYKYMFEENALDNGHIYEKNKCFCKDADKCLPIGLLDVSDCYYGFPIALSYPHFLDSNELLAEAVDGCTPNRSLHETYFYIQPLSGLPLSISVKLQINMAMRDVSNMAHVERFKDLTIPMLWFEITMPNLPEVLENRFNLYLNILPVVDTLGQILCLAGGIILLLWAIFRASLSLSKQTIPSPHKISKTKNKYFGIVRMNSGLSYEMQEKHIAANGGGKDNLCEIDINDEENTYMLENEPAISDNDEIESDSKSIQHLSFNEIVIDTPSNLINENKAFEPQFLERSESVRSLNYHLGVTSSSIDDIDNDNFHVLQHEHNINQSTDSISVILDNVG